jgi:hypothetical protein
MSDRVRAACEFSFGAHNSDPSGFARALAGQLNIPLAGNADDIVDTLLSGADWTRIPDGIAAAAAADNGKLVLAGLKGSEQTNPTSHGHIVVVVAGPLANGAYPHAYWGASTGQPGRDMTLNHAWTTADCDRVIYAAHEIVANPDYKPPRGHP